MPPNLGLLEESPGSLAPGRNFSPLRVLTILAILIYLAEIATMVVLYFLKLPNYAATSLLDGIIMLALILPGLYFLQLKPLMKQIEERTRAELALRASEELLKRVLELLPVGVWITDKSGKILQNNPASHNIWAGTRLVGIDQYAEYKGWWADSGKRIEGKEWAAARAVARGETSLDEEIEIEAFDGSHKIILNSALPILNERKEIQGAIVINQDITQRKQKEKDLIQTQELLERVFFSIDMLIAYMDRNFNFVRVNDAYARVGGYPPEFFIGKNHFDLYSNEENQAIFRQVVETGEPYSVLEKAFEYTEFPEKGVTYWDWSLQPVKGADSVVEGVVLSLVDVTERKRAKIQLERQNQELRELTRSEHKQRELAESLVQATIVLNASLEPDQVLGLILEQIRKAVPFQGADIILLEDEAMRVAGFIGCEDYPESVFAQERMQSLDDFPILQQVCQTLKPVKLDSVKDHPGWRVSLCSEWVRSYAAVPLIIAGKVIGVIDLYSNRAGAFTQVEMDRLLAFAAPAALALHNARLYQAESTARQAAETLSIAAQALTQILDLEHVINALLDHIQVVIKYDTAHVTMVEGEGRLTMRAVRSSKEWADREDKSTFPVDAITDSDIQRIKMTRKGLTIPNTLPFPDQDQPGDHRYIHSWLVIPLIANNQVIGLVEIGRAGPGVFTLEQTQWAEALVGQAAVAIQNAWLFEQVRSSSERLQSLARKLVEIQESERYHIARELHDEAGQALSSLKLSLGRLEQDPDCPPHMRQRLLDLKVVADGVLEELHRLAMDLRPIALDHLGLVSALEQLAYNLNSDRLSVRFKALGFEAVRLPVDVETSLYRIGQEALTNVVRHAHASNVGILLERSGASVKLFVEDDGIGLAPDLLERGNQLGLVGMRERAEMLRGSLSIESSPGKGTSIIVEVPDGDSHLDRG